MAISDYTFAGLKSRVAYRLQDIPKYTDEILGLGVNKAILDLVLFNRVVTQIYKANSFILTSGDGAGFYASEYPLPDNTLWCESLTFDGIPLQPMTSVEMAMTGSQKSVASGNTQSGTPRWFFVRDEVGGGKTAVLLPRPNRAAEMRFMGGLAPVELVNPGDVPPFHRAFETPIEFYAAWYVTNGQIEEGERVASFLQDYLTSRAEAKLNMRLDRKIKTQRVRDLT